MRGGMVAGLTGRVKPNLGDRPRFAKAPVLAVLRVCRCGDAYLRPPFFAGFLAPLRLVPLEAALAAVVFFDRFFAEFFPEKAASHPSAYFLLEPTRTILTAFTLWKVHS